MLLVFDRGEGPDRYRAVDSPLDADELGWQLNGMLEQGYEHHSAIPAPGDQIGIAFSVAHETTSSSSEASPAVAVVDAAPSPTTTVEGGGLLLVFTREGPDPYTVVGSPTDADMVEWAMNYVLGGAYTYYAAIPVGRQEVVVPPPAAVAAPDVPSNAGGLTRVSLTIGLDEERLLLVFANDGPSGRYSVVVSAAQAEAVKDHLNRMAREGYRYHTAIQVGAQAVGVPIGGVLIDSHAGTVVFGSPPTAWPHTCPRETEWVSRPGAATQYRIVGGARGSNAKRPPATKERSWSPSTTTMSRRG